MTEKETDAQRAYRLLKEYTDELGWEDQDDGEDLNDEGEYNPADEYGEDPAEEYSAGYAAGYLAGRPYWTPRAIFFRVILCRWRAKYYAVRRMLLPRNNDIPF